MRIPIDIFKEKLNAFNFITDGGKPISFANFKKIADIHQYGRGKYRLYIVYVFNSRDSVLAFYPPTCTRPELLKICYEYLLDTLQTEMKQEFLDGNVQWGNCGIPISYGDIRVTEPF